MGVLLKQTILSTLATLASSTAAFAGGYVAVVPDLPPVAQAAGDSRVWIGAGIVALLIALFKSDGHGSSDYDPTDMSCFREDMLIQMADRTFKAVSEIKPGDNVATSRGVQEVILVERWMPYRSEDRPVNINGIYLTHNHGVYSQNDKGEDVMILAANCGKRVSHNGMCYHHLLLKDHSWLLVKSPETDHSIWAESLALSKDMPRLTTLFPGVLEQHTNNPLIKKLETV